MSMMCEGHGLWNESQALGLELLFISQDHGCIPSASPFFLCLQHESIILTWLLGEV